MSAAPLTLAEVERLRLSAHERLMLRFALEMADDAIASNPIDFTDEDRAAMDKLRALSTGPVVAYRNPWSPGVLLCREHGEGWAGLKPLSPEDLPDGGTCTHGDPADPADACGRDVLSDAAEAIRVKGTAELTVFRASYDETFLPLGHYATRQAAMDHVHHVLAREENTTAAAIELRVIWRADSPDADEPVWECWLFDTDGADDKPTGYTVGPIEIATAYDPDGDE